MIDVKVIGELKEKLMGELGGLAKSAKVGGGDLTAIHMLADTIKNLCKIEKMSQDDGYSKADGAYASYSNNSYGGSYDGGMSSRGYSRDGGMSSAGYSRHEPSEMIRQKLGEMMRGADPETREMIERIMHTL